MKFTRVTTYIAIITLIGLFFTTSCVNNNKEVLFGCDSVNSKFASTVKPILVSSCYKCHSASNANTLGGGIQLVTYTQVRGWVQPGSSNGGILLNNVKTGRMPKNDPKISDCDISKLSNWINNGALDN